MKVSSWRYIMALALSGIGLIAIVFFILYPNTSLTQLGIKPGQAESYGSYVGGFVGSLFSLAGVFLLFETLVRQQDIFERQQFETRFYEMLKMHVDGVREIPAQRDNGGSGREAFQSIVNNFGYISLLFNSNYVDEDAKAGMRTDIKHGADLSEQELINLFFNITYVGFNSEYSDILGRQLARYKANKINYVLIEDFVEDLPTRGFRFGYENSFGIYFRHLYQTLKYIDTRSYLSDSEKQEYVTIIRSHLSANEIGSLFLYASTSVGNYPEFRCENPNNIINKYDLLRNLPKGFVNGIDHTTYYPGTTKR